MQMWSDYQKELNPNTEIYEDENGFIQFTYETDGKSRIFIDSDSVDLLVKDEIRIEISSSNLPLSFIFAEVETLI